MSQDVETSTETKETNPVEAQDVSVEVEPVNIDVENEVAKRIHNLFAVSKSWETREQVQFAVQFPTGQTALVKYLDTMDLVKVDLVNELDLFTKKLFPRSIDEQGAPVEVDSNKNLFELLKDPEARVKFLDMTNRLFSIACIKPKVINDGVALIESEDGTKDHIFGYEVKDYTRELELFGRIVPEKKDGEVYAGAINLQDRMTLYSALNQPLALIEPFRESEISLESVAPSESVGSSAE